MRTTMLYSLIGSFLLIGTAHAKPETVFVLRDLDTGQERTNSASLADQPHLPYSTFKVPNTLIGLETGVIPDEKFTLKWDGKRYERDAWNHDQDLASALRESVVWFYQEVARRIGPERMAAWLHKLRYGNEKSTPIIDRFWLDGDLRITPRQQVEFLARLAKHELPVSEAHVALLRRLLTLQTDGGCVLQGKTGTGPMKGAATFAWLVGYFDTPAHRYAYAYLSVGQPAPSREERARIVRAQLHAAGVDAGCK